MLRKQVTDVQQAGAAKIGATPAVIYEEDEDGADYDDDDFEEVSSGASSCPASPTSPPVIGRRVKGQQQPQQQQQQSRHRPADAPLRPSDRQPQGTSSKNDRAVAAAATVGPIRGMLAPLPDVGGGMSTLLGATKGPGPLLPHWSERRAAPHR